MNNSSAKVAELRKGLQLTQVELAKRAGLSQGTISRIESGEDPPTDLRLWIKIAKALGEPIENLLPDELLRAAEASQSETFYAFCPNPFCETNKLSMENDKASLRWASGARFNSIDFDEINFCARCGEDLIKDCPTCHRRLQTAGTQYCITCGSKVCDRPTKDEWPRILALLKQREKAPARSDGKSPAKPNIADGDHIKEDDIPF